MPVQQSVSHASSGIQYFPGGSYAAGQYLITYVNGAQEAYNPETFEPTGLWFVARSQGPGIADYLDYGIIVTDGNGNNVGFPESYGPIEDPTNYFFWDSSEDANNGEAGGSLVYNHNGGQIGLEWVPAPSGPYYTGAVAPNAPTFELTPITGTPPTIESFTADPTSLNCAELADGSVLSWEIENATAANISPGVGSVNPSSGSVTVYPNSVTLEPSNVATYTLTATNASGEAVATCTVTIATSVVTPPLDGSVAWFNNGDDLEPGVYQITCCGGSFEFRDGKWGVNWSDMNQSFAQAYKLTTTPAEFWPPPGAGFQPPSGQGRYIQDTPGDYVGFATAAGASSGCAGEVQYYKHFGGPLGIYLDLDSYEGIMPGNPAPSFGLAPSGLPGPEIDFSASPAAINAGESSTLSWSVSNTPDTVTIDNGIGSVSASGTQVVSPTVTTTYNITAEGSGVTQTSYVTVEVCTPALPSDIEVEGGCGGDIDIFWSTDAPTACTDTVLIERSATGGGVGFSQIGSAPLANGSYVDTPP
jgi:hypothetical protein